MSEKLAKVNFYKLFWFDLNAYRGDMISYVIVLSGNNTVIFMYSNSMWNCDGKNVFAVELYLCSQQQI